MAQYRKKPVVIDAFLFGVDEPPIWFNAKVKDGTVKLHEVAGYEQSWCEIRTLEGVMTANANKDFIIMGVNGELYPCKKDVFYKTYEKV